MTVRKTAGAALAALLLAGTVCAAIPQTTTEAIAEEASATVSPVQLTADNASLFLPESYEQYLALETPTDVAMSEHYIAIADGDTMHLFARGESAPTWRVFTVEDNATIGKIQFSGDTLYYALSTTLGNSFWTVDCSDPALEQTRIDNLNCTTFLIVGDTLYIAYIDTSRKLNISRSSLAEPTENVVNLTANLNVSRIDNPSLVWADGSLYCIADGSLYYTDATGTFADEQVYHLSSDASLSVNVTSVCSDGTDLFFSSSAGLFRRGVGSAGDVTELSDANGAADMRGLAAMSFYNGMLYCISGTSVREIAVTDTSASFTDYEIASASSSENRLSGASDSARADNLLITADTGNSRVSVYDFSTGEYTAIPCIAAPSLVATDGEIVACAAGSQIYLCNFAAGERTFTSAELPETGVSVAGLAVLYGETYYVKNNGTRGAVNGNAVEMGGSIPTGLACDLYGNLYVSYANGNVRRFTEDEFTTNAAGTDAGIAVASDATSLRADFEGNLYYLSDGTLWRNDERFATVDGGDFVHADGEQLPVSFALGFEDDAVYFNFGNYVAVSDASDADTAGPLAAIPTLGEIAESGARETAFSHHEQAGLLVEVAARAVGIETDLAAFRADAEGAYFPYCGYARSVEARQGILLASTPESAGGYSLVLFPESDGSYTARLYRTEALTPVQETWREESAQRWTSNAVGAYYAPCLTAPLSALTLARGTSVTVLGYFTAPDREYALVEYDDGAGRSTARGWIPASYLSAVSPDLSAGETYTLGYLKASDGILFTAADGSEQTVTQRVQVRLYDNGDGTYTARLADDVAYSAVVTEDMIDKDNAEVLRIALIVILSVLALVIVGVYLFLLPWEKYQKKRK